MSGVPVIPPSPNNTIACGIIFPVVAGAVVALRFYCRHIQQAQLLTDDWITIPAWLFMTGMAICLPIGVYRRGFAYPSPTPSPSQNPATFTAPEIIINRQLEYALELMQFPALTCVKLSFLFLYKRVFCMPWTTALNFIIWTAIALCTIWGVAFFFSFMFVCGTDFSAFWGTPIQFKTHCGRIMDENFWLAITDFALDAVIFIIPIPLIWKLQLSTTRKFAVLAIFAVGALTLAASITRMIIFVNALQVLKKAYKSSGTNNLAVTAGMYWTVFECGLGLIAACMPTIYVLLKRFSEKFLNFKTSPSNEGGMWSWKSFRSRSERSQRMNASTSEIEFVPMGAAVATIDTKVSKEHVDKYPEGFDGQGDGIMVSKSVKREEDIV